MSDENNIPVVPPIPASDKSGRTVRDDTVYQNGKKLIRRTITYNRGSYTQNTVIEDTGDVTGLLFIVVAVILAIFLIIL